MTAVLLTVAQLRMHVETDLVDEALQRLLDGEEAEIVRRYGEHATASETLPGGGPEVILSRGAASITSVSEQGLDDEEATALEPEQYVSWHGGRLLQRWGDSSLWPARVTVEYVPTDDSAQRTNVLIRLMALLLAYNGTAAEGVGDYRMSAKDYQRERERLLRQVSPRQVMFA